MSYVEFMKIRESGEELVEGMDDKVFTRRCVRVTYVLQNTFTTMDTERGRRRVSDHRELHVLTYGIL